MFKKALVEVHLGYYKQGDDLASCIDENKNDPEEALRAHAAQMRCVARHLEKIANMIKGQRVDLRGDTHYISIECNKKLAEDLIKAELASEPFCE